jgi:hypothetical protein
VSFSLILGRGSTKLTRRRVLLRDAHFEEGSLKENRESGQLWVHSCTLCAARNRDDARFLDSKIPRFLPSFFFFFAQTRTAGNLAKSHEISAVKKREPTVL